MPTTYDPIATTTLTNSTTSEVIFNTFGSGYTDLRIVFNGASTAGTTEFQAQFNSDSTGVYSRTRLTGNGSAAGSSRDSGVTFARFTGVGYLPATTLAGHAMIEILNYSNPNTFKTIVSRYGVYTQESNLMINLWRKTDAITSIRLYVSANNFVSGSSFSLYGIRAA